MLMRLKKGSWAGGGVWGVWGVGLACWEGTAGVAVN